MFTRVIPVLGHQMIGRHLVPPPLAGGDLRLCIDQLTALVQRAWNGECGESRVSTTQRIDRHPDELVDVANIIGEEHELLEMLRRSAGVMAQARETEVGARPVEQCQRPRPIGVVDPHAVGNLVAQVHELVRGEDPRQLGGADVAHLNAAVLDHISVRDFACRPANRNGDVIVAVQMLELVHEIVAEQLGPRDAGRVGAGLIEPGEGAGRRGHRRFAGIIDAKLRISERAFLAVSRIGARAVLDVTGQRLPQVGDRFVVNARELVHDGIGVELTFHGPH
jgi:hypothetical protein